VQFLLDASPRYLWSKKFRYFGVQIDWTCPAFVPPQELACPAGACTAATMVTKKTSFAAANLNVIVPPILSLYE
jgi:hypothetical protein